MRGRLPWDCAKSEGKINLYSTRDKRDSRESKLGPKGNWILLFFLLFWITLITCTAFTLCLLHATVSPNIHILWCIIRIHKHVARLHPSASKYQQISTIYLRLPRTKLNKANVKIFRREAEYNIWKREKVIYVYFPPLFPITPPSSNNLRYSVFQWEHRGK